MFWLNYASLFIIIQMGGEFILEIVPDTSKAKQEVAAAARRLYPEGWGLLGTEVFSPLGEIDMKKFHSGLSGRQKRTPQHKTILLPALQGVQRLLPKGRLVITVCDGWSGYGDSDFVYT